MAILVCLDGGTTYVEAKEGVRVIYNDVMIPGEDGTGELHLNMTGEGVISDLWTSRDDPLDHNIATGSKMVEDIVFDMMDVEDQREASAFPQL